MRDERYVKDIVAFLLPGTTLEFNYKNKYIIYILYAVWKTKKL